MWGCFGRRKEEVPSMQISSVDGKEYIVISKNDVATCSIRIKGNKYSKKLKMFTIEDMVADFVIFHVVELFTDKDVRVSCNFSYLSKYLYKEDEMFGLQTDIKKIMRTMFFCHSVLTQNRANLYVMSN